MSVSRRERISRFAKPALYLGMGADLVHKMSGFYKVLPPNILGKGTLVEKHIGNFGTSAILTGALRNLVLDNMKFFDRLEKRKGAQFAENIKSLVSFISVALLYITWETLPLLLGKENPQAVGDILVAMLSSALYLASYPERRDRIFFD